MSVQTNLDLSILPAVSVVVATRNRGDQVRQTIASILANDYPRFDLWVVDQSESDDTCQAVQPFETDCRLHYVRSSTTGVSTGRNLGITLSQGELIAITDDDCEAAPDWISQLVNAFSEQSAAGIVFGNVLTAPHDTNAGFIPGYYRSDCFLARSIYYKHCVEGISACMGLRRSVWHQLNGFDPMLGAGAPLKSAGETDFAVRALLAKIPIYETPAPAVTHFGFRTWDQGRSLVQGYMFGIAAALAKNLKGGHWSVLAVLFQLGWRWAFQKPVVDLGRCPPRWMRLAAFCRGAWTALLTPVERETGQFLTDHKKSGSGLGAEDVGLASLSPKP
ncbi:MAG: glycosyltransferase family 2 protein [Acidobacteria bacterium]|nr:glycosyltransferase family 2 protein [Acidobacteriota bacterium]